MFEIISETIFSLMGWLVGHRVDDSGGVVRLVILLALTAFGTWLTFYWRDIAYRSPAIRRRLMPNDHYSGRYLQCVLDDDEVSYAIVHIYFNAQKKRHEVAGRTYKGDASDFSSFRSIYILFPSDKDNNIEFIWQGRQSQTANSFGGYTKMTVASLDEDYIEGDGLILDFGAEPKRSPLLFKHLIDPPVYDALGVKAPQSIRDEADFIKRFHAELGDAVREGLKRLVGPDKG